MGHCLTHWRIKLGAEGALKVHGRSTVTIWRSLFKFFSLKRFFFSPVPFTDGTVSFTKPLYRGMRNLPNAQEGFWIGMQTGTDLHIVMLPSHYHSWKQKTFCLGCVQLGPGQVSANADIQCTFLPLFTNRWCQRESLSCPKPPGHSSCISF